MTGSLSVRNGFWYCVLYYRNNEGQYKQKWVSTGLKSRGNKKEAKLILDEKLEELAYLETPDDEVEYVRKKPESSGAKEKHGGDKIKEKPLSKQLFVDYIDKYIESLKGDLSPSVYFNYRNSTLKAIKEYFTPMKLRLCDVTTEHIQGFYDKLKERGLKNISLKHYGNVIRPALRRAYKEKLISENPYDFMPTLKREKVQHQFYDQQDMEKFFEVIKGHHLELAFRMLAFYGLRRSEVLGIRWESIDFINKTLTINHKVLNVNNELYLSDTMKTETSCRTLPLIPQMEKELLEQKQKIERHMEYFGKGYNMKFIDYVFVHENGDLVLPDCLTHNMLKIIRRFGLKHIRLHDLRHSCASIMLANGVQMKQIQDWLGHANFSTTADIYSHLDFSSKIQSAEKIANVFNYGGEEVTPIRARLEDIKPAVPSELARHEKERLADEAIDDGFDLLKSQMKALGFTKLSEMFAYLEDGGKKSNKKKSDMEM